MIKAAYKPPVATPLEIANRVGLTAQQIQLEMAKHPHEDRELIDKLLWKIRHGSTVLVGIMVMMEER